MTTHSLKTAVDVDLRAGGIDLSGTYGPGETELPDEVAELLTRQGHIGNGKPARGKQEKVSKVQPDDLPADPDDAPADPEETAPVASSSIDLEPKE